MRVQTYAGAGWLVLTVVTMTPAVRAQATNADARVEQGAEVAPQPAAGARPTAEPRPSADTAASAGAQNPEATSVGEAPATQPAQPAAGGAAPPVDASHAAPASSGVVAPVPPAAPGGAEPSLRAPMPETQAGPVGADVVAEEAPRGPIRQRLTVALTAESRWNSHPSLDLFSDTDATAAVGLGVGFAVWLGERLSVVPEVGYLYGSQTSEELFGGAISRADLDVHDLYVSVSARYELLEFFEPHVRLGGGLSILDVELDAEQDPARYSSSGASPFGTLGAGFSVKTADRMFRAHRLELGLLFEGGYLLARPFDVELASDQDDARIAVAAPSLGAFERSAPYLRVSFGARF